MKEIFQKLLKALAGFFKSGNRYSSMRMIAIGMVFTSCSVIIGTFIINTILAFQGSEQLEYDWLEAASFAATGITGKYWQAREEIKGKTSEEAKKAPAVEDSER